MQRDRRTRSKKITELGTEEHSGVSRSGMAIIGGCLKEIGKLRKLVKENGSSKTDKDKDNV